MNITVISECDSRLFIYPLIRCLHAYGRVAVFTSNLFFSRLIENEYEGGFKNVRIVVVPDGDLAQAQQDDELVEGKYDYIIYDNVGNINTDIGIAVVTNRISEHFIGDLLYFITENNSFIFKMGKAAPAPKKEKASKKQTASDKKSEAAKKAEKAGIKAEEVVMGDVEQEDTGDFNKWVVDKTEEDILQEKLADKNIKWIKFTTTEAIEDMEARHLFVPVDDSFAKEIHKIFKNTLCTDERQFVKEVKKPDTISGNIDGMDVR